MIKFIDILFYKTFVGDEKILDDARARIPKAVICCINKAIFFVLAPKKYIYIYLGNARHTRN
jgi:hypothetical protein